MINLDTKEKIKAAEFVAKYLSLCNEYNCEVSVNYYGVNVVDFRNDITIPFGSVIEGYNNVV
jgi:hypothetical protein